MEYKKNLMNDHSKQKQTQRKQTTAYHWEKEREFSKIEVGD